jgi:putative ABC transport system permease protein
MIYESIRIALRSLWSNKLRTGLTLLGIMIGVGAVIAMLAIGQGATKMVNDRFNSFGTNLIYIQSGQFQVGGVRSAAGAANTLALDDAVAIGTPGAADAILEAVPVRRTFGQIIVGPVNTNSIVLGTTPEYADIRNLKAVRGEWFTDDDVEAIAQVVLLGHGIANTMFPGEDPVGQQIRVNSGGQSVNLRVVGVLEQKGGTGLDNQDDMIVVPISVVLRKLQSARTATGAQSITMIIVKAINEDSMQAAIDQASDVMLRRGKNPNDFQIINTLDQLEAQKQAMNVLTVFLGAVAGISLVVGGIGIMNIMIVSVTERTREIGIRKAVGARRSDILTQFMMEAVVVSLFGGLMGVLMGIGVAAVLNGRPLGTQPMVTVVEPSSIVLAFGISAAIGLFFGIYPASRASRLNPIQALRYE